MVVENLYYKLKIITPNFLLKYQGTSIRYYIFSKKKRDENIREIKKNKVLKNLTAINKYMYIII